MNYRLHFKKKENIEVVDKYMKKHKVKSDDLN